MSSRNWSLIVYDIEDFNSYIDTRKNIILHYVAIYHFLDNARPHYHIALVLNKGYEVEDVRRLFSVSEESNCLAKTSDIYKSRFDIVPYFLHVDSKSIENEKIQYDVSCLYSDDLTYWESDKGSDESSRLKRKQLISDFRSYIACEMSKQDLYVKYGRDVILHFDTYLNFVQEIMHDFRKNTI